MAEIKSVWLNVIMCLLSFSQRGNLFPINAKAIESPSLFSQGKAFATKTNRSEKNIVPFKKVEKNCPIWFCLHLIFIEIQAVLPC